MNAAVCIPWRPTSRDARSFDLVRTRWEEAGYEVVVGDAGGKSFNRSASRNHAAKSTDAEKLIFCDADTTPVQMDWMETAVAHNHWTQPETYHAGTRRWTDVVLAGGPLLPIDAEKSLQGSPGGIIVVPREMWLAVGGFDESFDGWGWEDTCFVISLEVMFGHAVRDGEVVHLWHQRKPDRFRGANRQKYRQYREAATRGELPVGRP